MSVFMDLKRDAFVLLALIAFCLARWFKQKALSSMVEFMDLQFL